MKIFTAVLLGLSLFATTSIAQTASGSASGAGADQGGSGTPGGGTGVPGAITSGQTATGVGSSSTSRQQPVAAPAMGSDGSAAPAQQ